MSVSIVVFEKRNFKNFTAQRPRHSDEKGENDENDDEMTKMIHESWSWFLVAIRM